MRGKTATERKKSHVGDYSQYLIEHCLVFFKETYIFRQGTFSVVMRYIYFLTSVFLVCPTFIFTALNPVESFIISEIKEAIS